MIYAIIALAGLMSFISARNTFYPLKWAASFFWWALLLYWIDADILVDGSPSDVAVMLGIVFVAMLFLLWGMAGRKGRGVSTIEERYDSVGKLVDKVVRSTTQSHPKQHNGGRETPAEYQTRVRSKLPRRKRR